MMEIWCYNTLNGELSKFALDENQAQVFADTFTDAIYFFSRLVAVEIVLDEVEV